MQVHIFDPQLNASDGHYLEYDSAVATELRRRGIHTSLLGSTRRTGALSAPGDTRPVFTAEIFDQISHDRLVWALEDFDQIGSQFHKNLASLDTGQFSVTDIAFFPNLTQNQLGGIRAWICGLPPERRPILILKFSYLTYAMGYVQRRPNKELIPLMFRFGIRSLLAAHPRTVICTDSEEIAGELKAISGSIVPILPLPLTIDEGLAPHDRRELCVAYLGYPGPLKGFHLLPQIISQFAKGPDSPRFLVQSYSDREGCSQIENALEGLPNVTLIRGFVSRPTYNESLSLADIVLMPYLREFYGWATSGIFAEALSAGKVVVVPEQTWMSRQLASYRAGGTTFAVQDANHITAALRRALSNFGSLSQSASSARAAWKAHHCPASFVDRFLALASELAGRWRARMLNHIQRRVLLMKSRGIDLVLDVGANTGQFGTLLRQLGFRGRIISFEPLQNAFATLRQITANDPLWDCHNLALGDLERTALINISANSYSSSFLPVSARSVQIEPTIAYIGQEAATIRRLDTVLDGIARPEEVIYLKIDTQGYELNVLKGALGVIDRFPLIQLETAFSEGYEEQPVIENIISFLRGLRYRIVSIEPGWEDPRTGELLEADLIFARD